ncbi:unnamed protein product [Allacma fusca]|uniref:Uncharacterized protein n=1 Tax=Allacma fusca TaxID=39272 RepID=A0A8J2P1E3_9HEXA|nr:unnamed protein product [Allacma fusca]
MGSSSEGMLALRRAFGSGHFDKLLVEKYFYAAFFSVFLGKSTAWILGRTPPWAMVTPDSNLFNSSSLRMASWR